MLNDQDFLRYSRQLLLEDIGTTGQKQLEAATVLLVGLGGLGSPASMYLAAAGVGTLLLADYDNIHITNLQRQILYRTRDIGELKAKVAQQNLTALNPQVHYIPLIRRLQNSTWLDMQVKRANIVLDCSDNMLTRHAINAACVRCSIPLISASAVGFSGQLIVLTPPFSSGCYACLFPSIQEKEHNCRTIGILGPVVGIMGTIQALEAIKLICGLPMETVGKLLLFNGKKLQLRVLALSINQHCLICANHTSSNIGKL
ncbi:HesA/MoeB/ThiF family protein [Candidatus Palibaumannia cicadellinicola]|uniref:4-methyl-5-(Beta-hydroxyethyl)thiazole monophosphate synthesis protein n=1 Tax=Baumannia cicadellinicola subsp. Homalodisca coagulata TaxID=374463 RepID=Q1LU43_BAUCH|nr:HesA/MoeB/ThiF family protein [Candidatus Baumannia cicadellinicola]ABF14106.1 4-methyl-5-(beta-hydroxyethyl)thiazole monophosphate synthesis protein [Baumannia cicadellinicola str. Hc (Homalodisca coagulata)]MCJ7462505.1 HesA/MoeB/ThiF family protein [Candidatus Baumannia cicadellinicola]MCJ7463103.1 HesA/MoeB/ThiF family protein [Candidatus Baumannia cicadellinicola]